jgi:hypothetical protein
VDEHIITGWSNSLVKERINNIMKTTPELIELYTVCTQLAMKQNQTVGEKNDYYVTLEQIEWIIKTDKPINK